MTEPNVSFRQYKSVEDTLLEWERRLNYLVKYLVQSPANSLVFAEQSTIPATPATGQVVLYANSTDGRLYSKDDAGAVSGPL